MLGRGERGGDGGGGVERDSNHRWELLSRAEHSIGCESVASDRDPSNLVPFYDSALCNEFGEQPKYVLSAWGITVSGPMQFAHREIKDERRQVP